MKYIFTKSKKIGFSLVFMFALLLSSANVFASHVVGGDVEYECVGPRQWKIRLTIYRDCTGVSLCGSASCPQPMVARPSTTLNPPGCTATPNNVNFTLSFIKVQDVGKGTIAICGNTAKNGCNNLNTVSPGPFTPSIEGYTFEGILNLNLPSLNSSNCAFWDVYWELCCRNAGIANLQGSSGQSFRIGCTINIFNRSSSPCVNNSPIIKNEPVAIVCSGQEYVFNMGAVDPDNDSLTYQIDASLQQGGGTVVYQPPFGANYPFPLNSTAAPHINFPQPNGPYVVIDSVNGDISFNAVNNTASYIFGNLNVRIKQWTYDANGNPVLAGITQRDLQLYVINCPANNPPRLVTIPALQPGNRPRYDYSVCAGQQVCFTVTAKDTDVYPAIPRFDTTFISWNQGIVRPGKLSFGPTYPVGAGLPRPREDSWQFCWQTEETDGRTLPYYFTVTGLDNFCPRVGRVTRSFSIRVLPIPKVASQQVDLKCGKRIYRVMKTEPKQTFSSAMLEIAANPYDWNFTTGKRTLISANPNPPATGPIADPRPVIIDTFTYTKGGKYLARYTVSTPGYEPGQFCTKIFTDTILIDTAVRAFVNDTFTCKGTSIVLNAVAKWGNNPYTYRWFRNNTTGSPVFGPSQTANAYTASDTVTTKYYVRVFDLAGCQHTDSMMLEVKNLPVPVFAPDSARICFGQSFTLNAGNNAGNVASYRWSLGSTILSDTTQSISRQDSGNFTVLITDTFGCRKSAMLRLRVNEKVLPYAGVDTSVCPKDTVKIGAIGGHRYKWDRIQGMGVVNVIPKGYIDSVRVAPTTTTDYIVTAYYSYPDTTAKTLECSNSDTVRVVARPLPNLSPTQPQNLCRSTDELILPFRFVTPANQQGGVGLWSYTKAPNALVVNGTSTTLLIDSLNALPKDTFYASMQSNLTGASNTYYIKYAYRGPASAGACLREDSTLIRVLALPKVTAGSDRALCINRTSPYQMDVHDHYPPDINGKVGIWSITQGVGLDSVVNVSTTKYSFNPAKPGALVSPQYNTLRYKYTITYNLPAPTLGTLGCVNMDSAYFTVVPTPVVDAGTDFAVCKNEPIFPISTKASATTTSTVPGSTYWSLAPGQLPNISAAILVGQNFNAPSTSVPDNGGTWKLYYSDTSSGCKVYDSVNMEVIKLPVVDINYALAGSNDSVCKTATSVQFTGTASPLGGTGVYSGTAVSAAGIFNVQDALVIPQNSYTAFYNYSVTSKGTTCSGYDSIITFVQQPPTISVAAVNPKCDYDVTPFNLTATASPSFYGVKWSHDGFGSFDNDIIPTPTYTFNAQDANRQFLNVTATTTNNGVCAAATDSKRLDINPTPTPDYTCDSCMGCAPINAYLWANGSKVGGSTYDWFLVNGTNETPFAPSDSAVMRSLADYGKYVVKLKVTTPAGCTSESFDTITVYAVPNASFESDPPFTTIAKPFFNFTNKTTVADGQTLKYEWNMGPDPQLPKGSPDRILVDANPQSVPFGDSISCNIPVYLKVVTQPGGCIDTAMRTVCINPDITVFIPSAFRPVKGANTAPCADPTFSDCNEVFRVYADGFATIEVYVFNRWGQQVYMTNDPNVGWNGLVNNTGAECPQDVYIYQINANSYNGKKYTYSGSITLLR